LKSKEPKQYDNKLNVACLAQNFNPKNVSLDVPKSNTIYDLKAPLVTAEGIYSTMKVAEVEPGAEVTCKAMHKGNKATANIILPGTVLLSELDVEMEKMNMVFLAVLGLRILLAKSIAFNAVMSIKLFLF
ncbi:TRDC protein, partial [Urocolius indicus]|nr:TRDC protein [Urocolius indicus]